MVKLSNGNIRKLNRLIPCCCVFSIWFTDVVRTKKCHWCSLTPVTWAKWLYFSCGSVIYHDDKPHPISHLKIYISKVLLKNSIKVINTNNALKRWIQSLFRWWYALAKANSLWTCTQIFRFYERFVSVGVLSMNAAVQV